MNSQLPILQKELRQLAEQEQRLTAQSTQSRPPQWKQTMEAKIPRKVYAGIQSAFVKSFRMVFSKGSSLIEKTFQKDNLLYHHRLQDYRFHYRGGRQEMNRLKQIAQKTEMVNLTVTTVEGIGLGALGIGLPDILLFIAAVLKGVYETALSYGFDYENPWEQGLILRMMEASLAVGEDFREKNRAVDWDLIHPQTELSPESLQEQIQQTASAFAVDMLLIKFVQGLPVVGLIGGAANPLYYKRILSYVELKYRKRYLLKKLRQFQMP